MPLTGIIYESNCQENETAVKDLMMIVGAGRHFKSSEFPADRKDHYGFYAIGGPVTNGKIDERITGFVDTNRDWLAAKKVFLFGLVSAKANDDRHFTPFKEMLGEAVLSCENIIATPGELDLVALAETGLRFNERAVLEAYVALPPAELLKQIEKFLTRHNYCILSTAYGDRVRGNTQTYVYRDGYIYILWESSTQFANLILNDNVCVAFFAPYDTDKYPGRIQCFGKAEMLEEGSDAYRRVVEMKGHTLEEVMAKRFVSWVIAIKLKKVELWWSAEWERQGVGRKQTYHF